MKNFLATILCFVYITASSGATINFHYCMGKFIGWDVAVAEPAACSNCGMHKEQKKGCCNDKHQTFQLKKDYVATTINYAATNTFVYIYHKCLLLNNSVLFISKDVVDAINSPPLIQPVPYFIFNCVFRI